MNRDVGPLILQAEGITKRFTGVLALDGVDFDVRAGEVHVLVGENGAGKSTLVKVLAGVHPPDAGTVLIDSVPVMLSSPRRARELGIAVIHQEPTVIPELSVAENLFLARQPRRFGLIDWARIRRDSVELLERVGLHVDPATPVRELGIGHRQLVEIARALDGSAKVLVLDEPTAALTSTETDQLLEVMAGLRDQRVGLVFITHHLQECRRIADRITVLRDGRNGGALPAGASVAQMIELMVGRRIDEQYPRRAGRTGGVLLKVDRLSRVGAFREVSFEVRAGEVVGLAGLVGAGRTEVLRAVFGVESYDSGRVHVAGRPLAGGEVGAAMRAGLGLVPEDRQGQGLVLCWPVVENLTLAMLRTASIVGFVDRAGLRRRAGRMCAALRVQSSGLDQVVRELSGGNQQKVVIGRWLLAGPRVLLLDEPTRGVDVGAKVEIYELINRMTAEGRGVLLVSSDLPEVIGMCDRILVLAHGRVTGELPAGSTQDQVMALAVQAPR